MIKNNDELDVVVTLVSPVGVMVEAQVEGVEGFVDLRKHPSWWADVDQPRVGDRLHVVVLDGSRTPPRLSALQEDIEIARRVRGDRL